VLSTYFTPGVYRGIVRGKIMAAPTDSPVLQGRLSVDQAVELLEGGATRGTWGR
jgi:protein TorT